MKTYKNLFEEMISTDNILEAIKVASRGKKERKEVQYYLSDEDNAKVKEIRSYMLHFYNDEHNPIVIFDKSNNKERTIYVPTFREQIVHHAIVQVLHPLFMKGMYEHSYASIPGRGSVKASKIIRRVIDSDKAGVKYYLKMDVKKFFNSINHTILYNTLKREIKDKRFMNIVETLFTVIDKDNGLPLGFYTSQWFANYYLERLDHYIKEDLQVKHYFRYMDDMVIFYSNKRKLGKIRDAIFTFLKAELDLNVKENYQIRRFSYIKKDKNGNKVYKGHDLDFMGYRFFRDKTILRKRIYKNIIKTVKSMSKRKYGPTISDCRRMMSYMGWVYHTDSNYVYRYVIMDKVNIGYLRKKLSNYDRKRIANLAKNSNIIKINS